MKIGILSMQQVHNYGSFLQAYGLKTCLQEMGHDVCFINIKPGKQLPEYKRSKFHKLKLAFERIRCRHPFRMIHYSLLIQKRFSKEFCPELGVEPQERCAEHYDTVVIGSDEVFNVAQATWFGFSRHLFGEGIDADRIISYAACCGATTTDELYRLGIANEIAQLLSNNFHAISVRDDNSVQLVKKLTGITPEKHIDPVLLYNFEKEIAVRTPHTETKYLLVYTYPNRIKAPTEIIAIKNYAKKHSLRIISHSNYFDWADEVVTPHPFETLAYFRDATCIVTDTFHGTVMSIKYARPFATIVRNMNSNKLSGLLNQFNLSDRQATTPSDIDYILSSPINYEAVAETIKQEQLRSKKYLTNTIQINEQSQIR